LKQSFMRFYRQSKTRNTAAEEQTFHFWCRANREIQPLLLRKVKNGGWIFSLWSKVNLTVICILEQLKQ
jgi:hypothetical protein